jgi:polyphosphate glucokinase
VAERFRVPTPRPSTPEAVGGAVAEVAGEFGWKGPVGITFPGVVIDGRTMTAANVDRGWVGLDARELFAGRLGGAPVSVLNDADAAGLAEMRFGAGADRPGVVLVLTFGTGIGSALFVDGTLVPNTEFGHLEIEGKDAERRASDRAREEHDLSWGKWAGRVGEYLRHLEALLSPALIIIGGGVSKKSDKFLPALHGLRSEVVAAALRNEAGIVGAARYASTAHDQPAAT